MGGCPTNAALRLTARRRETILVTGAAGVLGEPLLARLAGHRVICLVHRRRPARNGAEVLWGDVARPGLGLAPGRYRELAREVDCVLHAAAVTSFAAPVPSILASNVWGTRHALALARVADARFVHVSTAFVAADPARPAIDRPRDTGEQDFAPSDGTAAYLASKREAEAVVRCSDVPHLILRPPILAGDADTGRISEFQALHLFAGLALRGQLPVLPADPAGRVDFLPRDVVADAIVELIEEGTFGEYWLTAGERALSLAQLLAEVSRFAGRLGEKPHLPRFVDPDTVDRLIRPVFLPRMPEKVARRLEMLFALMPLVSSSRPFPSSFDELGLRRPGNLRDTFTRSLEYWHRATRPAGVVA